jgi:hypothetical protein
VTLTWMSRDQAERLEALSSNACNEKCVQVWQEVAMEAFLRQISSSDIANTGGLG